MNRVYPLLFLIVAGLCFYAGYTVGMKKVTYTIPAKPVAESAPVEVETTVVEAPAPPPAEPVVEAVVVEHEHSLRAAKQQITFTDNQGRELVAEVMEASEGSLKVRRVRDQQVMALPTNMLCEKDQAFAKYLAEQAKPEPAAELTQDEIWADFFK